MEFLKQLKFIFTKRSLAGSIFILLVLAHLYVSTPGVAQIKKKLWEVQSIDTMKYSRDVAREKSADGKFDTEIEGQIQRIAATGATHVAIATPYDPEFIPFLKSWVFAARKYNLNVWFRGNFAGWEGWFGYPKISRSQHKQLLSDFIAKNSSLFKDGDILTVCPECENGGPGDPRRTGDVAGHRSFLIDEYKLAKSAFEKLKLRVLTNYNSMNGDVANLIMDKPTTQALGGVVVIDHYVASVDQLVSDIKDLAARSGGQVVLGEVGVPIPDIHGKMTGAEQAEWLDNLLIKLERTPEFIGLNYWTNTGSSTELWKNGIPNQAVGVLTSFYNPRVMAGVVTDEFTRPLGNVVVASESHQTLSDKQGKFQLILGSQDQQIRAEISGFTNYDTKIKDGETQKRIVLIRKNAGLLYRSAVFLYNLLLPFNH